MYSQDISNLVTENHIYNFLYNRIDLNNSLLDIYDGFKDYHREEFLDDSSQC